jgi:hypothetical protein
MIKTTFGAQKVAKMQDIQFAQVAEKHISFHKSATPAWIHVTIYAQIAPKVK